MEHKKLKLIMAILFLGLAMRAQQATITSGGDAYGIGGASAYSIGQVTYTANSSGTGSISQGTEQPIEIFILNTNEQTATSISLAIFPNPTVGNLILKVENFTTNSLSYELLDINGKLLKYDIIKENQTQLSLANYAKAIYFINIIQGNKKVKSFKIIKN